MRLKASNFLFWLFCIVDPDSDTKDPIYVIEYDPTEE